MRVQNKKLVDTQQDTEHVVHDVVGIARSGSDARVVPTDTTMVEEIPTGRETFEVALECQRCHHK